MPEGDEQLGERPHRPDAVDAAARRSEADGVEGRVVRRRPRHDGRIEGVHLARAGRARRAQRELQLRLEVELVLRAERVRDAPSPALLSTAPPFAPLFGAGGWSGRCAVARISAPSSGGCRPTLPPPSCRTAGEAPSRASRSTGRWVGRGSTSRRPWSRAGRALPRYAGGEPRAKLISPGACVAIRPHARQPRRMCRWLQLHCQGHPSSEARSAGSRLCVGELLAHGLVSRIGKDTRGVDGEGAGGVEATLASWQRSSMPRLASAGHRVRCARRAPHRSPSSRSCLNAPG